MKRYAPWWPVSFEEVAARASFSTLDGSIVAGPVTGSQEKLTHPLGVAADRLDGRRGRS